MNQFVRWPVLEKWCAIAMLSIGVLSACSPNKAGNPYNSLSNNNQGWQDVADQSADGTITAGSLRKYFFFRNGSFQILCEASDASCLVSNTNTGLWDYITATTVQVSINNGPILFYDIVKLDANNLWLQDNNTKKKPVLRQLVPAK